MKILCDVCSKEAAMVFCCADEAALCDLCDRKVHLANKLASKHRRFSLSAEQSNTVVCDICKEKGGLLFCQEDRAILCTECDAPIHSANKLTMKHNRFLLPGVRISAEAKEATKACSESNSPLLKCSVVSTGANVSSGVAVCSGNQSTILEGSSNFSATATCSNDGTSSISDYLTKMCPGWGVEDLLIEGDCANMNGFFKADEPLQFREVRQDTGGLEAVVEPHVPQHRPKNVPVAATGGSGSAWQYKVIAGGMEGIPGGQHQGGRSGRARQTEHVSMVPDIIALTQGSKRTRQSSWYY